MKRNQSLLLMPNQNISTITFEEAMELFKIPFNLNDYEGKEVIVGVGRFGPYIKWGDAYISIPKTEDPLSVDNDRAIEIIEEKRELMLLLQPIKVNL